jgi:hypothetical protein
MVRRAGSPLRAVLAPEPGPEFSKVKILGETWYDLGSDVDWEKYGGMWGRPVGEGDVWQVIALSISDSERGDPGYYNPMASAVEVKTSQVDPGDLETVGESKDGLDEYGDLIRTSTYAGRKAAAYVRVNGTHGKFGGDLFTDSSAKVARARAARSF